MKSRFLLESLIGPCTLKTARQLIASVALCAQDQDPPWFLIDDHLPYPQALLQIFGQIKHRRHKNGRGRFKYPRLKPPPDLQVGVVKKLRDDRGNLLKVSTKALFGKKKDIEKRIQQLGLGQQINTSQMERLNGTIRGQQARLARRTRNGSHRQQMLQSILDLALARFVQLDQSALFTLGSNSSHGLVVDRRSVAGSQVCLASGSCQRPYAYRRGRTAQQTLGISH